MIIVEKLSLDEVTIVPSITSIINSRSECDVYDENGFLPLFTAPMNTVIDENTIGCYQLNKVYGILPRTVPQHIRLMWFTSGYWVAIGLDEIQVFVDNIKTDNPHQYKILIDIANGHMINTFEKISYIKHIHSNKISIMLGNIANPKTIETACKCGVDYIRVGIGGGNSCITSSNTGICYPMASLISETYKIRENLFETSNEISQLTWTKIVADGGMKNYSDIIKSLALGADYVMCGTLFAKTEESPTVDGIFTDGDIQYKNFYGMSTKHVQKMMGKESLKTSEGVVKRIVIDYTLDQWLDNFKSYLQSTMSYTSKYNLPEFKGNVDLIKINNTNIFNK